MDMGRLREEQVWRGKIGIWSCVCCVSVDRLSKCIIGYERGIQGKVWHGDINWGVIGSEVGFLSETGRSLSHFGGPCFSVHSYPGLNKLVFFHVGVSLSLMLFF